MATIMVTCPVMDRPVSTGILVDAGTRLSAAQLFVPLRCGLCGGLHFWCMKEAWCDEAAPLHRPPLAPATGVRG
jgi:hypothetical protein